MTRRTPLAAALGVLLCAAMLSSVARSSDPEIFSNVKQEIHHSLENPPTVDRVLQALKHIEDKVSLDQKITQAQYVINVDEYQRLIKQYNDTYYEALANRTALDERLTYDDALMMKLRENITTLDSRIKHKQRIVAALDREEKDLGQLRHDLNVRFQDRFNYSMRTLQAIINVIDQLGDGVITEANSFKDSLNQVIPPSPTNVSSAAASNSSSSSSSAAAGGESSASESAFGEESSAPASAASGGSSPQTPATSPAPASSGGTTAPTPASSPAPAESGGTASPTPSASPAASGGTASPTSVASSTPAASGAAASPTSVATPAPAASGAAASPTSVATPAPAASGAAASPTSVATPAPAASGAAASPMPAAAPAPAASGAAASSTPAAAPAQAGAVFLETGALVKLNDLDELRELLAQLHAETHNYLHELQAVDVQQSMFYLDKKAKINATRTAVEQQLDELEATRIPDKKLLEATKLDYLNTEKARLRLEVFIDKAKKRLDDKVAALRALEKQYLGHEDERDSQISTLDRLDQAIKEHDGNVPKIFSNKDQQ